MVDTQNHRQYRDHWEHFPHGADVGLRGFGATKEAAFIETARALTAAIANPADVSPVECVTLACAAPDDEALLVEWLNAIVFEMAVRGMLFSRFVVRLSGTCLQGEAWGEPIDVAKHQPAVEVKGVTYTALRVQQQDDGTWLCQCIADV
ncbi:MAG: archease [Alphaproteobacteria bacterium]